MLCGESAQVTRLITLADLLAMSDQAVGQSFGFVVPNHRGNDATVVSAIAVVDDDLDLGAHREHWRGVVGAGLG